MEKQQLIQSDQALYVTLSRTLSQQIRDGVLPGGSKAPSERKIAENFGISRGTARLALQELERNGFVERRGGGGSFIRYEKEPELVRIVFLSTVKGISQEHMTYANWCSNSEFYRGLLEACSQTNAQLTFRNCPTHLQPADAEKLVRDLRLAHDGCVITGDVPSLVQELLGTAGMPLMMADDLVHPGVHSIFYDVQAVCRETVKFLLERGNRTVGVLFYGELNNHWNAIKMECFRSSCQGRSLEFMDEWMIGIPTEKQAESGRILQERMPQTTQGFPDVFLTTSPLLSVELMRIALRRHWRVPEEMQVVGYGNVYHTDQAIFPITYIDTRHAESGEICCHLLVDFVRKKKPIPELYLHSGRLEIGGTTR